MKKKTLALCALLLALSLAFAGCYEEKQNIPESVSVSEIAEPVKEEITASEPETPEEPEEQEATAKPTEEPIEAPAETAPLDEYDAIVASMTLREKVGMLFWIRPESLIADKEGKVTSVTAEVKRNYEDYPAGGFVLFNKNLKNEKTLKKLTSDIHKLNERAFIAIDEEGGTIVRIAKNDAFDVERFPDMEEIALAGDESEAYRLGFTIGSYLSDYGIDADFAPVADVNTNPDNPVIGKRAFGNDPEVAAGMVCKVIDGLHDAGVLSCIKHFPGHGDTTSDTHKEYAETLKTWEEIKAVEMIPFAAGIGEGTDMVMVAHISAPNVTGDDTPASLSKIMITDKLRGELGFDGVIVTDALDMQAITDKYGDAKAAEAAFLAGADILLMPEDYYAAFDGIMKSVNDGTITENMINESVKRILKMKNKRN